MPVTNNGRLAFAVICSGVQRDPESQRIDIRNIVTGINLTEPLKPGVQIVIQSTEERGLRLAVGIYGVPSGIEHVIRVQTKAPSGAHAAPESVKLPSGLDLVTASMELRLIIVEEGEYNIHVFLDDDLLTVVPLRITH